MRLSVVGQGCAAIPGDDNGLRHDGQHGGREILGPCQGVVGISQRADADLIFTYVAEGAKLLRIGEVQGLSVQRTLDGSRQRMGCAVVHLGLSACPGNGHALGLNIQRGRRDGGYACQRIVVVVELLHADGVGAYVGEAVRAVVGEGYGLTVGLTHDRCDQGVGISVVGKGTVSAPGDLDGLLGNGQISTYRAACAFQRVVGVVETNLRMMLACIGEAVIRHVGDIHHASVGLTLDGCGQRAGGRIILEATRARPGDDDGLGSDGKACTGLCPGFQNIVVVIEGNRDRMLAGGGKGLSCGVAQSHSLAVLGSLGGGDKGVAVTVVDDSGIARPGNGGCLRLNDHAVGGTSGCSGESIIVVAETEAYGIAACIRIGIGRLIGDGNRLAVVLSLDSCLELVRLSVVYQRGLAAPGDLDLLLLDSQKLTRIARRACQGIVVICQRADGYGQSRSIGQGIPVLIIGNGNGLSVVSTNHRGNQGTHLAVINEGRGCGPGDLDLLGSNDQINGGGGCAGQRIVAIGQLVDLNGIVTCVDLGIVGRAVREANCVSVHARDRSNDRMGIAVKGDGGISGPGNVYGSGVDFQGLGLTARGTREGVVVILKAGHGNDLRACVGSGIVALVHEGNSLLIVGSYDGRHQGMGLSIEGNGGRACPGNGNRLRIDSQGLGEIGGGKLVVGIVQRIDLYLDRANVGQRGRTGLQLKGYFIRGADTCNGGDQGMLASVVREADGTPGDGNCAGAYDHGLFGVAAACDQLIIRIGQSRNRKGVATRIQNITGSGVIGEFNCITRAQVNGIGLHCLLDLIVGKVSYVGIRAAVAPVQLNGQRSNGVGLGGVPVNDVVGITQSLSRNGILAYIAAIDGRILGDRNTRRARIAGDRPLNGSVVHKATCVPGQRNGLGSDAPLVAAVFSDHVVAVGESRDAGRIGACMGLLVIGVDHGNRISAVDLTVCIICGIGLIFGVLGTVRAIKYEGILDPGEIHALGVDVPAVNRTCGGNAVVIRVIAAERRDLSGIARDGVILLHVSGIDQLHVCVITQMLDESVADSGSQRKGLAVVYQVGRCIVDTARAVSAVAPDTAEGQGTLGDRQRKGRPCDLVVPVNNVSFGSAVIGGNRAHDDLVLAGIDRHPCRSNRIDSRALGRSYGEGSVFAVNGRNDKTVIALQKSVHRELGSLVETVINEGGGRRGRPGHGDGLRLDLPGQLSTAAQGIVGVPEVCDRHLIGARVDLAVLRFPIGQINTVITQQVVGGGDVYGICRIGKSRNGSCGRISVEEPADIQNVGADGPGYVLFCHNIVGIGSGQSRLGGVAISIRRAMVIHIQLDGLAVDNAIDRGNDLISVVIIGMVASGQQGGYLSGCFISDAPGNSQRLLGNTNGGCIGLHGIVAVGKGFHTNAIGLCVGPAHRQKVLGTRNGTVHDRSRILSRCELIGTHGGQITGNDTADGKLEILLQAGIGIVAIVHKADGLGMDAELAVISGQLVILIEQTRRRADCRNGRVIGAGITRGKEQLQLSRANRSGGCGNLQNIRLTLVEEGFVGECSYVGRDDTRQNGGHALLIAIVDQRIG